MGKDFWAVDCRTGSSERENLSTVKVLAVGEPDEWQSSGNILPQSGIAFVGFSDVTEEMLGHLQPNSVFSPVLASSFDCIELAIRLHGLGFSGNYSAVAGYLPNPKIVEREVRQICPRFNFSIILTE